MAMKLADRSDLKRYNRRTVYETILNSVDQSVSCAQISRETGISLPTVIKITNYFESRGLLQVLGTQESSAVGRRPTLMKFVPGAYGSIGAAYDGKYLELVAVDLNYKPQASRRIRVRGTMERLMGGELPALLDTFMREESLSLNMILSIGLALPVVIDTRNYRTDRPAPLVGIQQSYDFGPQCTALKKRYNCPVYIENDVNAAAIGEFRERGLSAQDDLVYITLGNGIGSGILLSGELRRGRTFAAGEIGNMVYSGEGCCETPDSSTLEARLSPDTLLRMFGYNVFDDNNATSGDTLTRVADYVARHLTFAILNIASILDVEQFVLGGFMLEALKEQVFRYISQYISHSAMPGLSISPVSAAMAPARGAGAQACDKALDSIFIDGNE